MWAPSLPFPPLHTTHNLACMLVREVVASPRTQCTHASIHMWQGSTLGVAVEPDDSWHARTASFTAIPMHPAFLRLLFTYTCATTSLISRALKHCSSNPENLGSTRERGGGPLPVLWALRSAYTLSYIAAINIANLCPHNSTSRPIRGTPYCPMGPISEGEASFYLDKPIEHSNQKASAQITTCVWAIWPRFLAPAARH